MSSYVIPASPVVGLPIAGSDDLFPVRRVYCVGRNYAEHAKEMGFTGREDPFFFCKPADAVVVVAAGQTGQIKYPSKTSNFHYEMELVVALGKGGVDIPVEQANDCIFGYALGLDMTRRDLQGESKKQGRPWETGKAFDESAPVGLLHPRARVGTLDKGGRSEPPGLQIEERIFAEEDRLRKAANPLPELFAEGHGAGGAGF